MDKYQLIESAYKALESEQKALQHRKVEILKEIVKDTPSLVRKLAEWGIPDYIFVSGDIERDKVNMLSHFTQIITRNMLEPGTIAFLWTEDHESPPTRWSIPPKAVESSIRYEG